MATIPTQTYASEACPINDATDFTVLAACCAEFAETLLESTEPPQRRKIYNSLSAVLSVLQSGLHNPVPHHLINSLTVDERPASEARFEPDSEQLAEYCLTLTQILKNHEIPAQSEKSLTGLLYDLVSYFSEDLCAPRYLRTAQGLEELA
ncbi:hypothetical protein [Rahnella victoriana]|uniref:Uncharacterized protein n=1 Tax=Rahnella victoriana TaxID=1510570 RepID=A0ABS0DKJ0_9GAMM|nr:hypothetical protein [Rahnella victoriana]MBF7954411.1 hypothetical protein [Rahnella victoriana]